MLTDHDFWRVILYCGLPCAFILVSIRTGASPLFWVAVLASWLEAALRQGGMSAMAAVEHFKVGFRQTHREVRAEVALVGIGAGAEAGAGAVAGAGE